MWVRFFFFWGGGRGEKIITFKERKGVKSRADREGYNTGKIGREN